MPNPPTRYARSNAGYVAYQTFGEGPRDLLFVANWASNLDAMWDEPSLAHYFHRLGRIGRVICFDKRGSGVSDPVPLASLPTLEEWMELYIADGNIAAEPYLNTVEGMHHAQYIGVKASKIGFFWI